MNCSRDPNFYICSIYIFLYVWFILYKYLDEQYSHIIYIIYKYIAIKF